MGRMSDLEKLSRERLKFTGAVTMKPSPGSELVTEGLGPSPAVTSSASDSTHLVRYAEHTRIEDHIFFHEFCHVKLNEVGFRSAEGFVDDEVSRRHSSKLDIAQIRAARAVVSETLADSILYRFFRVETEVLRNQLDYSFLMTNNLRVIERRYGLRAIIRAASYRVSKEHAGFGEQGDLGRAVRQALGQEAVRDYERLYAVLSRLPVVGSDGEILRLDDAQLKTIVDCVVGLYEIEIGAKRA